MIGVYYLATFNPFPLRFFEVVTVLIGVYDLATFNPFPLRFV
jgi:hypothetical protein